MISLPRLACNAFQRSLLDCASLLVPREQRRDWRREWTAELWHVRQACLATGPAGWKAQREVAGFCAGAFQDAFFLRWHCEEGWQRLKPHRGSPLNCLIFLVAALALTGLLSILVPGVRVARSLAWNRAYQGAVLIRDARTNSNGVASISHPLFQEWATGRSKYFDAFAFYRIARAPVLFSSAQNQHWEIASASANLFTLLGVPLRFASPSSRQDAHLSQVILSDRVWRKDFNSDPDIAGAVLRIRGQAFRVAGVTPRGAWRLPEKVDAWLLQPDSAFGTGSVGYVVAHLSPLGNSEMWAPRMLIKAYGAHDAEIDLMGVSLDEKAPPPWAVFALSVLLALLALPATASVSMSEYGVIARKLTWPRKLRRWSFLAAKLILVLIVAYFASFDLAYAYSTLFSPASVFLHLASSFLIALAGLGWACRDQRQRCPVCLHRVTSPAQVGAASQTFLGWSGTELMCAGGHTLLHIPALPTSWFSAQRWLFLDGSWDFLFAG